MVGKGAITFEGLLTDWEHIGEQMEKGDWRFGSYVGGGYGNNCDPVEERRKLLKHTVLELAKAAEDVPEEAFNQAVGRAAELATKHGYEFLSEIGVHPLGSTGSKSQFLPPLEQRGRWRHFLRYVAMPSGGMGSSATFNGDSAGLKDPRGWFPGLPEPQWTMLELAVAPGTMTPEQYEEAKRDALKLVEKIGLEGMVDLGIRPAEEKASPSVFVPDPKQPGEWTNYVTLVAGPGALTFEGESVTWEQLPARLAAVPDRSNTVFCFAGNQIAARAITPGAKLWSELKQRAHERIAGLGFKHFSNIGWHELGTKGGPSIFTPFTPGVPIRGRRFEGTQGESAPMGAPASAPATNSGKAEDAADSADPLDLFCEELEKVVAKAASRTQQFKATYEACKQLKPEEVTLSASMRQWLEQIPEAEALLAAPASDPALAQARLDEQARLFESGYRNALWQELKLREELARSRSQAAAARDREWQPTSRAAAPERAARLASPTWDLRAQAEGVVKQVLVKAGQIVHQGDVLVTLDDEDIRIELDDARARLEFAQRESALQKQRYQAGLCDEAGYRQAEASAKLAEIDIRRWELRLERTQIKSPCDGYVQIDVRELLGKPVSAGEVLVQIVPRSRPAEKPAANNLPANPSSRPAQGAGIGGPSGVVRLGDGEAAAGATVLLIRPAPEGHAYAAYFVDGKIQNAAGSVVMQTNEAGRFSFAEQQGPFKLVVLDDRGYAETGADNLQPSMVIELKPWGKVEGKLRIGGRVSAGEKIVVQRVDDDPQRMTICHRFETTTDAQGHFVLNRVAPCEAFAGRELEYTRERSNTTFFDHAVPVGVQPGQTAQVTIGGTGRTIVGRVTLPTGHRDFGDTFTVGTLSRPHPGSPPHPENIENMSMAQRLEWWNTWSASAAGKAWMKATSQANMMHTAVMVQADGSFRSEDIPPGNYLLNIRVHELHKGPAWGVGAQIGGASQAITVDNGPADKPVDAGTIQLKAQPSVRAAKSQPAAGTQPSAGIGAKLSYAWLNDPESDPRYLSLTFPDGVFEDARNDAFADTFGAWLEWVAGLKPDPPKLFEHPRLTGDRIQVNVITGRGGKYFGDVLYQFDKNVFYFRGHSTLENRTDTADRCYGPFPADALRSLNLYAPGLHRSASATHAFARNLQVPAGSAYGLRNPPVTRYVLAGQASADVLGFDSEAEWEAAIQQARSPEEATRLRLQHNYAIALEQFGRESPITQRMDADLRAYEAKLAASRPASGTSRD